MYIMKCGHVENAKTLDNKPFCAICNCDIINKSLDNNDSSPRYAKCHCGKIELSSQDLPFFRRCESEEYDRFYCGCDGWN